MRPEEYLVRERGAEAKSEYLDGKIVTMVGASRAHNLLTINVAGLLWQQLGDRPCEVYSNDMRVKIPVARVYTYPDVVVSCDDPLFEDDELDTLLNPIVIVEVLSASTEAYDRGKKFSFYRSIPSLIEYVLVAQDEHRVEHYLRQAGGHWLFSDAHSLDDAIALPSIRCVLALRDVHAKVDLGS